MARQITSPFQVLCEGDGDDGFITALRKARGLPSFDVTCVSEGGGFEDTLKALEFAVDRGQVRKVLILADNDADPTKSFDAVKRALGRARIYPVPKRPLQVRNSGRVATGVVMLPGSDERGNLETLLLRSVVRAEPDLVRCAENFAACSLNGGQDPWTKGQRDKMLLRSVLSARIRRDPNCSLAYVWGKEGCPIDPSDESFAWIADFVGELFR